MITKLWKLFLLFALFYSVIVPVYSEVGDDAGSFDSYPATPPNTRDGEPEGEEENVILWWTPFTGIQGQYRSCSSGTCFFTENRKYLNGKSTKAVLFYGSDFNVEDLPLPRPLEQWWALLHEESPKNQPLFDHENVLKLFNLTSTFRRGSNFPLTLQHLESIGSLVSQDEYMSISEKTAISDSEHLAPVVYVQSDCDTLSERDKYVEELSKYIEIDSYGTCLHNRDLPPHLLDSAANFDHPEFRKLIAKYKFALSIENAACEDYITEKFWRPLSVGTIPIYWGSPTISDWSPNPKSIIDIRTFGSPRQLAQHLYNVLHNETLYKSFLEHKENKIVSNTNLIKSLNARKWGINNDFERGNFIEHFECYVCDEIVSHFSKDPEVRRGLKMQASADHYGCPQPESVLTGKPNSKSFWVEEWHKSSIEAEVLRRLVSNPPGSFTSDQFFAEVIDKLQKDGFFHKLHSRHEDL